MNEVIKRSPLAILWQKWQRFILIALPLTILLFPSPIDILIVVLCLGITAVNLYNTVNDYMVLDDKGIHLVGQGILLGKRDVFVPWEQVQAIEVLRSGIQQLLGIGDIKISHANGAESFCCAISPQKVKEYARQKL